MKSIISLILLSVLVSFIAPSSAQSKCMPGSFNKETGLERCIACPRGTYARGRGKKKCRRCKEGYSTQTAWSRSKASCRECPNDLKDCRFCPAGSYGEDGIEPCFPCRSGTASSGGESSCNTCPPGTISGGERAEVCLPCPFGSKANVGDFCVRDTSSCSATDPNVHESCRLCQPGTSSATGYEPCAPCPLGMLNEVFGATECMACKFGSSTPFSGARSLGVCESPLGSGSLETRAPTPTPVAQPPTSRVCVAGQQPVGDDCVSCSPGSFKGSAGSGECEACPENFFQDVRGQTSCKPCAEGYITSGVGATECFYCPNESRKLVQDNASEI